MQPVNARSLNYETNTILRSTDVPSYNFGDKNILRKHSPLLITEHIIIGSNVPHSISVLLTQLLRQTCKKHRDSTQGLCAWFQIVTDGSDLTYENRKRVKVLLQLSGLLITGGETTHKIVPCFISTDQLRFTYFPSRS